MALHSLLGEGQGGGCHTARHIRLIKIQLIQDAPLPGLPPSPSLPHKEGGSKLSLPRGRSLQARACKASKALLTKALPA